MRRGVALEQVLTRETFPCINLPMTVEQQQRAKAIGDRIVAARKRKGMSQMKLAEALAERSGLDPESVRRSIGNNERGKYAPRVRTLQVIAEVLEQPLEFFVGAPEVAAETAPFRSAA